MIRRFKATIRKFGADQSGAVVVDHIPVFFLLILIVLLIFEIGIAYFLNLRSHKAAQLGARVAAVLPPVHTGVPLSNVRTNPLGRLGLPCYNPNGADRCQAPGGPWICEGSSLSGDCDLQLFLTVVNDMRRTFPNVTRSDVTITYIYRGLGETGGSFVPEVNVSVTAQDYEFVVFGVSPTRYGAVSASAFGEEMTPNLTVPGSAPGST